MNDTNITTKKLQGFSLVELLITIAVIAIVLTVGVPALNDTLKNNRLIAVYNQLNGLAAFARAEATKRNLPTINVTLCKSKDNKNCANASTGFNVIVFVNRDGDANVDIDDTLLKSVPITDQDIEINISGFADNLIHFTSTGTPIIASDKIGKLMICDERGNAHANGMIMNISGQMRQAQASETLCS